MKKRKKKRKEKLSHRELIDLMGVNRPTYKRVRGAIRNSSKPGERVLDPFGGSGSTLIACEQTGRICHMMEYDPVYAEVIIRRWEEFTGQNAVKLE